MLACMLLGVMSAPATATLMIGPDVPAARPATGKLRMVDANAAATAGGKKLSRLETGGMLAGSVLFSLLLWRGVRPRRAED
jgi:hypothetical protein